MIPIEQTVFRAHNLTLEGWSRISEQLWEIAGETWHNEVLPKHFTAAGAREHGATKRSQAYEARKRARFGHNRPLVYTGRLEEQAKRAPRIDVKGRGRSPTKRVSIKLRGPRYLRTRSRIGRELKALSQEDERLIAQRMEESVSRLFDEQTPRREEVRP